MCGQKRTDSQFNLAHETINRKQYRKKLENKTIHAQKEEPEAARKQQKPVGRSKDMFLTAT